MSTEVGDNCLGDSISCLSSYRIAQHGIDGAVASTAGVRNGWGASMRAGNKLHYSEPNRLDRLLKSEFRLFH